MNKCYGTSRAKKVKKNYIYIYSNYIMTCVSNSIYKTKALYEADNKEKSKHHLWTNTARYSNKRVSEINHYIMSTEKKNIDVKIKNLYISISCTI